MNKISLKYQTPLIVIGAILLALYIRRGVFFFESIDFKIYLNPWYNYILQNGKIAAIGDNFGNYNSPYIYLLVLASYLLPNVPNIVAIKLVSIAFDFIGAFLVYKIVRLKYPTGKKPLYAFIAVLFAPTVFTNSAYWGQCDMIYTSGLLAFIYFAALRKDRLAFIAFGLAFAFKFQALFLAPSVLILMVKRYLDWRQVFWIPIVYLASLLPALIAGRPWKDLLSIYANQSGAYDYFTRGAPNLYQWIPNRFYSTLAIVFLLTIISIAILALAVMLYRMPFQFDLDLLIKLSLFCALVIPYILPKMHDRYFFPADIFSIVYGFYFPSLLFIPIITISSSFLSYLPFLTSKTLIASKSLSLVLLIPVVCVIFDFFRSIERHNRLKSAPTFSEKILHE